jgi:tetratricopeptide (TPR) repeat protein
MKNKFLYFLIAGSLCLAGCEQKTEKSVVPTINHLLVGNDYLLKGDFNKAIEEFNIHLKNDSLKNDSLSLIAYYNIGVASEMSGNYANAVEYYTKAININPDFTMAYYKRGLSKKMTGDNAGSVSDLAKAVELKPDFVIAMIEIAHIQSDSKNVEKNLVEMLTNSINKKADSDMLYQYRGLYQYIDGNINNSLNLKKAALSDFEQAIKLNPGNIEALYHSGLLYGEMKDYTKAVERFTQVIEADKNHKSAYMYRGVYNYNNEKIDIACADFKKAKELGETSVEKYIKEYCTK